MRPKQDFYLTQFLSNGRPAGFCYHYETFADIKKIARDGGYIEIFKGYKSGKARRVLFWDDVDGWTKARDKSFGLLIHLMLVQARQAYSLMTDEQAKAAYCEEVIERLDLFQYADDIKEILKS